MTFKNKTKITSIIAITFFVALILIPAGMNAHATSTFEDDFTDCTTNTCDGNYIVQDTNAIFIDIINDELDFTFDRSGSNDNMSYNFGSEVCKTDCVLRFQYDIDSQVDSNLNVVGHVMISSSSSSQDVGTNSGQDGFGFTHFKGGSGSSIFYAMECADNRPTSCNATQLTSDTNLNTGSYYFEIIKTTTQIEVCYYPDNAYAASTDCAIQSITGSWSNDDTNGPLQYLYVADQQDSWTGSISGSIDNIQVWDGVTEVSSEITIEELQNQILAMNATINQQQEDIDYLYEIWEDIRDTIVNWLTGRP